jgi:magnesium-transporting ATPase (P-type)
VVIERLELVPGRRARVQHAVGIHVVERLDVDFVVEAVREAQTLAVTAVVLMQMVYVVQCRSLTGSARDVGLWRNPWIYVGIAGLLALQLAFVYLPLLHRAFWSAPLDGGAWLRALAAALTVVPVVAAEKWWRRRAAGAAHRAGAAATPA